jgi:hypothetical protein
MYIKNFKKYADLKKWHFFILNDDEFVFKVFFEKASKTVVSQTILFCP